MKPNIPLTTAIAIAALAIGLVPTHAETIQSQGNTIIIVTHNGRRLNRAKNLARQAAEEANGGLSHYRAEKSMYGSANKAPFVDNGDGTWTFTIKGRRPNSHAYTIETVVTVSKDGKRITVDYNGAIHGQNNR